MSVAADEMKVTDLDPRTSSAAALELALAYVRDGTLSIDEQGKVWRHFVHDRHGNRKAVSQRSAETETHKGYLAVTLGVRGTRRTCKVFSHILGWVSRNGPIPDGLQVNHKDLNKANNHPDNHELTTQSENILHSYAHGRTRPWSAATEWRPGKPKLTEERKAEVVAMRDRGLGSRRISAATGISKTHVERIIRTSKGGAR